MQALFILQKFLLQLRRQNIPLVEPGFDQIAQIVRDLRQPRGAVASAIRAAAAADTSAIRWRAAAIRVRSGSSASIFADFGEDALRGFPAGGWSDNCRVPPASWPATARKKSTGDRGRGNGGRTVGRSGKQFHGRRNAGNSSGEQRENASIARQRKTPATNAPAANGSLQRAPAIRRPRARLAHALDGVKIFQGLNAGQRLRPGQRARRSWRAGRAD